MKPKQMEREKPLREIWDKLTEAQRQQIIREQIEESDRGEVSAASPDEQARLDRVMGRLRGRGRPRVGRSASRINVTVEKGFLRDIDKFRKRLNMSRSELIARGIRMVMDCEAAERRKAG
jgi:hypothetical protein